MRKIYSIILSIILLLSSCFLFACNPTDPGINFLCEDDLIATQPYVKWEGRYAYEQGENGEGSKVNLYHSATGFTIDFVGTELYVEFDSTIKDNSNSRRPYYNVAVDDEVLPTINEDRTFYLTGGRQRVCIVSGLENKRHTVKCLKMSEPYDALTSVISLETDGKFIKRNVEDDLAAFRFMFVCASGGSGHGALGYSDDGKGSMGRNTANSSALHSFNYLTARMFGADVQYVGNSGWGVSYPAHQSVFDVIDYTGITTSNNVNGAKQTPLWDYTKWTPDVIIFNIGGNDTRQFPTDDEARRREMQLTYQTEVVELVEKLHTQYPYAYMIWTHTNSNAGRYAMSALNDAGITQDGYLKEVIIPKLENESTVGANDHYSLLTHITAAQILADALSQNWGFTPLYENVTLEQYDSVLKKF